MTDDKKSEALAFLKSRTLGVLATLSPTGAPRARTVYYAADDSFSVYFCTMTGTRKVEDMNANTLAAFVVSEEDAPKTIQIEGTITNLTNVAVVTDEVRELLSRVMERGPFFAPITHLDPGAPELYKLTPTWVRFGDFTDGIGTDASLFEIPL